MTAEETCDVCEADGCACGNEACCGSECIGSWSPVRRALTDVPLLLLLPASMPGKKMGKGPEGPAEERKKRQRQRRKREALSERLADEHDEATRAVKQRRSGNRFRFRRRRQAPHHLRTAYDAFYASFIAALWVMLVAAGVSTPIGNTASGTDTGGGWTLVRTAVEVGFPGSTQSTVSRATFLHPIQLDLNVTHPSFRHAYAMFCYTRLRPATVHASGQRQLQPRQTCIRPSPLAPSLVDTRPSLPAAYQLHSVPPIIRSLSPARLDHDVSNCLPERLRPAVPPARRPNCPDRLAWTKPSPGRSVQHPRTNSCHVAPQGTPLSTLQKYGKEKGEKKTPNNRCNILFNHPEPGHNAYLGQLTSAGGTLREYALATNLNYGSVCPHRSLRAGMEAGSNRQRKQYSGCSTDTWAPAMNHTPEPGSGVRDMNGPSPMIAMPLQRRTESPNLSRKQSSGCSMDTWAPAMNHTPEPGSGVRDIKSIDEGRHSRHTAKQKPSPSEALALLDAHIAALTAPPPPPVIAEGSLPATVMTPPSPCSSSNLAPEGRSWNTDPQTLNA